MQGETKEKTDTVQFTGKKSVRASNEYEEYTKRAAYRINQRINKGRQSNAKSLVSKALGTNGRSHPNEGVVWGEAKKYVVAHTPFEETLDCGAIAYPRRVKGKQSRLWLRGGTLSAKM